MQIITILKIPLQAHKGDQFLFRYLITLENDDV